MSIWATIIGGAAGMAIGGPIGALLGGAAGHMISKKVAEVQDRLPQETITFTVGVIALAAKMAKADGRVTRDEVNVFKQAFRVSEADAKKVGYFFDLAKQEATGYEPYAVQLQSLFHNQPEMLEEILDILFYIAKADQVIHPNEEIFLENVARIFRFSENDFRRIREGHLGPDKNDPYHVLGVDRSASEAEIRKKYLQLIKEHHPDRLMAQGMPEEFIEVANEKLAAINAAYDQISDSKS